MFVYFGVDVWCPYPFGLQGVVATAGTVVAVVAGGSAAAAGIRLGPLEGGGGKRRPTRRARTQ